MSLKNPVTPLGIDPGTVRLVAQCLKHYANIGPSPCTVIIISKQAVGPNPPPATRVLCVISLG
jgi:hypothetical protein